MEKRLQQVQENIRKAAKKAGRDPKEVTLIGVTKTHPIEEMQELIDLGLKDIGENKAQEVRDKVDLLNRDARWHFIGHLQRNKVKYLVESVHMIHSVESESLAKEISKRALRCNRVIPVLLEVNVSGESTKFGLTPDQVEAFLDKCEPLKGIDVQGLMTMAPHYEDIEKTRPIFHSLKSLLQEINAHGRNLRHLSMGMSNDYEIAVEEGATYVRVGTAIMGQRDYAR